MGRLISIPSSRKMAQYDIRLGGAGVGVLQSASRSGRAEGAKFIQERIIRVTERAFDDFAGAGADAERNRRYWD